MELNDIREKQRDFDARHKWLPTDSPAEILKFLQEDTIGLCGEVGELAGIVKVLALESRRSPNDLAAELSKRTPEFEDEVVDVFIYLIRIATYLNIDLEQCYLRKLSKNRERFRRYES